MDEIKIDPSVQWGAPCLKNTDLRVWEIVSDIEKRGLGAFSEQYPSIHPKSVLNMLDYCSQKQCEKDHAHCYGCSLKTQRSHIKSANQFIDLFEDIHFEDSHDYLNGNGEGTIVLPGKVSDFEENWRGQDGWKIASKLRRDIGDYKQEEEVQEEDGDFKILKYIAEAIFMEIMGWVLIIGLFLLASQKIVPWDWVFYGVGVALVLIVVSRFFKKVE